MFIKEMKTEECFDVLTAKRIGRLACVHKNQPYIVPFHFAFDGRKYFYAFSTPGQKIEWMRSNPLVCVEVDDMKNQFEWTSLIAFGRYEELPDLKEFTSERIRAYELLSRHPMWWQPVYVARDYRAPATEDKPIYFRILVEKITGRRGVPDKSSLEMSVGKITGKKPQKSFFGFWRSHKPDSLSFNEQEHFIR